MPPNMFTGFGRLKISANNNYYDYLKTHKFLHYPLSTTNHSMHYNSGI
jgi:hypothetical protein